MMKHKKRAWDMSNPLYRYIHSRKSGTRKKTKRVEHMARRHGKKRGGFGGMGGMKSLLKNGAAGYGASRIVGGGLIGYAAGYFTGGIPGVVGALVGAQAEGMVAPRIQGVTQQVGSAVGLNP